MSSESEALSKQQVADIDPSYGGGRPISQKGHWRADLCFPLIALYCLPCAVGDLMQRLDLGIVGRAPGRGINSPWNVLVGLFVVFILLYTVTAIVVPAECMELDDISLQSEAAMANCDDTDIRLLQAISWLTTLFFWFMMYMVVRMRLFLRRRDNIPPGPCCPAGCPDVCEDIVCGCCCTCLTVIQMHRHIDDHKYCRELYGQEKRRISATQQHLRDDHNHTDPTMPSTDEPEFSTEEATQVEAKIV